MLEIFIRKACFETYRCCCGSIFIFRSLESVRRYLHDDQHTFYCNYYFVFEGIRTCLKVSSDPMFLWISSNSCPLNLLLVRSHQAEIIIIVKHLIQRRNNVTRMCGLNRRHRIRVVVKTTFYFFRPPTLPTIQLKQNKPL